MIVIPAIDIINGKCVRLTKGDYDTKKVYNENPLEMAKSFEDAGATHIHLVDLDAAKGDADNLKTVFAISQETKLSVQMGGGIRNETILKKVFDHGVDKVIIGSKSVKNPEEVMQWIKDYGSEKIIIGADVNDGFIATDGWYKTSTLYIDDFVADYINGGAKYFLCTDIAKDGMLQGISIDLYKRLVEKFEYANFIASGGVKSMEDVVQAREIGMHSMVIGKAIYEEKIKLEELFQNK